MLSRSYLEARIGDYMEICDRSRRRPSYCGLSEALGCSHTTIANIVRGTFNGIAYTVRPSPNRLIDNSDFAIVRTVFEAG